MNVRTHAGRPSVYLISTTIFSLDRRRNNNTTLYTTAAAAASFLDIFVEGNFQNEHVTENRHQTIYVWGHTSSYIFPTNRG